MGTAGNGVIQGAFAFFGNIGDVMHMDIRWDTNNIYLYVNGNLLDTTPIAALNPPITWGPNSYFNIGAGAEFAPWMGRFCFQDTVADFKITSAAGCPCIGPDMPQPTPHPFSHPG